MSASGESHMVLIVEDAELCASTLEVALQRIPGMVVRSASSSEEALNVMAVEEVSALITDLHLPEMGGLDLVARARGMQRRSRLPIIVISGDTDPRTPARVREAGADAFFLKPYSPAAVRRTLENLICGVESPR